MYVLLTGAISNAGDFLTKEKKLNFYNFLNQKGKY